MIGRRRCSMIVLAALCIGFGLTGCAGGNVELDPAYWFPDGKKKLPGERRELFPEGVPGVTQGIPPELVRGNPAQQAAQDPALAPTQEQQQQQPAPAPPPQAQEKPKPRPKRVARPRPAPAPEPAQQPAPPPAQSAPSGAWPAPQAQQQPAPQQAPAAGAWPAPPAAGTFTR